MTSRVLRVYQQFFNDRFQTYHRFVHFIVHYGDPSAPETRRGDTAQALERWRPFAVVNLAEAHAEVYQEEVTREGVVHVQGLGVTASVGPSAGSLARTPGLAWSFVPSIEQRARLNVSFLCAQVVGRPVSFSGNDDHGSPRRLGLLWVDDDGRPDLARIADLYRSGVQDCGGRFEAEATVGSPACAVCNEDETSGGVENMARFQQAGITTVVSAGASNGAQPQGAELVGYRPEWVLAGDHRHESTSTNQTHPEPQWQHARTVTTFWFVPTFASQHCVRSAKSVDPTFPDADLDARCSLYATVLQLFTGVQVAGPRLSVETMDQGLHAIPAVASDDPTVPGCFYLPGDYTCIKDGASAWWDPQGANDDGTSGCWRMVDAGRRHLAGAWPIRDIDAARTADDPCSIFGATLGR